VDTGYEDVWRESTPHVLAALVRRYGDFAAAEDALQEALLAAARQWPADGTPENPRGWLIRVASRRLVDVRRTDQARAGREVVVADRLPADELVSPAADAVGPNDHDDSLALLVLCCHPALSRPSQVALTLRAVAGLSTDRIARAFLVPSRRWRNGSAGPRPGCARSRSPSACRRPPSCPSGWPRWPTCST